MFDRYQQGENALLVHVFFPDADDIEDLHEFQNLVRSANIKILDTITTSRKLPSAKYFIGQGKAEEICQAVTLFEADVILVNHNLSPAQERNLELLCKCRVVDRISLILDIFAQRARTHEGKLQVELAQLQHLSTRLVRGWTHLERQKGGIGLRGPGETQLETDRRLLRKRIQSIQCRLNKVVKQRNQGRQARVKSSTNTLAVVGYTNAGKSTLFNRLTQANVYAEDQLFATLDPTIRKIQLHNTEPVVLADTVGFIRNLPHNLVAAFQATLQEAKEANLLLHVVDASASNYAENIDAVNEVLAEIDAINIPTLMIMNKIDLIDDFSAKIERDFDGKPLRVWLSAETGEGIDLLIQVLEEILVVDFKIFKIKLPIALAKYRSQFYQLEAVEQEDIDEDGNYHLQLKIRTIQWLKLLKQAPELAELVIESDGLIL